MKTLLSTKLFRLLVNDMEINSLGTTHLSISLVLLHYISYQEKLPEGKYFQETQASYDLNMNDIF